MRSGKLKLRLARQFGKRPDPYYFHGDMEYIRAYHDYRRAHGLDVFLIDDDTWNDLDMDRLFKRINPGRSTSGEQYLYYMLRSPAQNERTYESRKSLIGCMESNPELRLDIEVILTRLGCKRRADICTAFAPVAHGGGALFMYLILLFTLLSSVILFPLLRDAAIPCVFGLFTVNALVHERMQRRIERELDRVNYTVSMIFAVRNLKRLRSHGLDEHLKSAYQSLVRLRSALRIGYLTMARTGTLWDAIATFTLLDLIGYELIERKIWKYHGDVFTIHECLGRVDAAIAIASYRESVSYFAEPDLRFSGEGEVTVYAEDMVHPLLKNAVPNDWITDRSMLITGSNASGKSTYLKTAALAAIMAQSICTAPARSYKADVFQIYSSMTHRDDLLAGESYYVVETKSLKRILDSVKSGGAVICVIDEVLRGTNTVERIAASCEVLKALAEEGGSVPRRDP